LSFLADGAAIALARRHAGLLFGVRCMSTEQQMQQSLADLPAWMLILVALAGLTGEMWRAEAAGVAVGVLVKRVLLRFGSSALFGVSMLMFVYWLKQDYLLAGAMGIAVGLIGADIAGGIYARYLAKKAGVCNVERQG